MNDHPDRMQRPRPERTEPIRSFTPIERVPEAAPSSAAAAAGATEAGRAARLGYQVIEEYLRQGQRAAEAIAGPFAQSATAGLSALSERLIRDGLQWVELFMRMSGSASARVEPAAGALPSVSVQVGSGARVEVALQLQPNAAGRPLELHPLHSPTGVLASVRLEQAESNGGWRVQLCVPEGQAPGQYSGIVFDAEDGGVRGVLVVRVEPAA